VTGGAGFIGSHLAERLAELGHPVRVVDNLSTGRRANLTHLGGRVEIVVGDLVDPAVCRSVADGVEVVFHVAALPSVPRSLADPWGSHQSNVNATVQLLLAAQAQGVRRLVYSSSSSAYGDTPRLPKAESMEPMPRSPYAASKLAGEHYVLAFARAGRIEAVALRYFNVFGPRQNPRSQYAAVIPLFLDAAFRGDTVSIYGDGEQTRDFTYVANVVEANLLAADRPAAAVSGHVVNVGAGERTSLNQLVALIREVTGRELRVRHESPRAGDVRHSLASLRRASRVLRYKPRVQLIEGLRRTWEWVLQQVPDDRAPAAGAGRPAMSSEIPWEVTKP
jgi:UDP-glucose 4-epimerase